jgi:serine/threonine protein kinase
MNKSLLKRVQKVDEVKKEVAILKKMKHPNVVQLFEVIDDPVNDYLFLVMEYVQNGPVMKLENGRSHRTLSESKSRKFMIDILNGLEYLHSLRVCHRDIKPENLLLDSSDVVKLSDFGVSQMFEGDDDTLKVTAGTPAFLSPEACAGENFSGKLADIWALGITLFIFTFGYPPFFGESYMDIYKSIQQDELSFPEEATQVSPELVNLIKRMLDKDAKTRIRLADIKNHPWITQTGTIEEAEQIEQKHVYEETDDDESDPVPITDSEIQNAIVQRKLVDQLVLLVKMKSKLKKMASDARLRAPDPNSARSDLSEASDTTTPFDETASTSDNKNLTPTSS